MVMSKARNLLMGAMIYAEGTQLEDKTYRYRLQRCEKTAIVIDIRKILPLSGSIALSSRGTVSS